MFSSGLSSWGAAWKLKRDRGTVEGMVLLFADTLIEDEDNYRFLHEAAVNIGAPLIRIAEGRTPGQVMLDKRFLGNSKCDPCSELLKRKLLGKWTERYCKPDKTTLVFGISWDEEHRLKRLQARKPKWKCVAPLCEFPFYTKRDLLRIAEREGLKPPRMYGMGFPHANCGGFCIKAGQATFRLLLQHFPERYAEHERWEEQMRGLVGNRTILKDRRGGTMKRLTLRQFRGRLERDQNDCDPYEYGGCGCALD